MLETTLLQLQCGSLPDRHITTSLKSGTQHPWSCFQGSTPLFVAFLFVQRAWEQSLWNLLNDIPNILLIKLTDNQDTLLFSMFESLHCQQNPLQWDSRNTHWYVMLSHSETREWLGTRPVPLLTSLAVGHGCVLEVTWTVRHKVHA